MVVFLDYDGTLTHIVDRPELAELSDEMRATLKTLADLCTVAVISGRDRSDVERRVGLESIFYAGSHGFDIAGPHGRQIRHEEGTHCLSDIAHADAALRERLSDVKGALVERKKYSVAVHFRLVAPQEIGIVSETVDNVLSQEPNLRKTEGKKIYELQPRIDWDKGKAVLWLLRALNLASESVLPLYLGDDITDEDAFRALSSFGIGIYVGEQSASTAAQYALRNPAEVQQFLRKLIALLGSRAS